MIARLLILTRRKRGQFSCRSSSALTPVFPGLCESDTLVWHSDVTDTVGPIVSLSRGLMQRIDSVAAKSNHMHALPTTLGDVSHVISWLHLIQTLDTDSLHDSWFCQRCHCLSSLHTDSYIRLLAMSAMSLLILTYTVSYILFILLLVMPVIFCLCTFETESI